MRVYFFLMNVLPCQNLVDFKDHIRKLLFVNCRISMRDFLHIPKKFCDAIWLLLECVKTISRIDHPNRIKINRTQGWFSFVLKTKMVFKIIKFKKNCLYLSICS